MKKFGIVSICLFSSLVYAEQKLYDNISMAIHDLAVVRVKSSVRLLNDLDIPQEEKRKAIQRFVVEATKSAQKLDSKVSIGHSLKDMGKVIYGCLGVGTTLGTGGGVAVLILAYLLERKDVAAAAAYINLALHVLGYGYILKKGIECYSQRGDLDKALRIKKWLIEQQDRLAPHS
jgi:hypothetical protein